MAKFQSKAQAGSREKPPVGEVSSALELQETFLPTEPPLPRYEADRVRKMPEPGQPKRGVGRPSEGVKGFATRMSPETIADVKALADGLRLRSEGKAIEKAVSFYKAHLLREVKAKLGDLGDEEELLRHAHKVD